MEGQTNALLLSAAERSLLAELLESAYRDLKAEIGRTEGYAFKAELQARRDTLAELLQKVTGQPLQG